VDLDRQHQAALKESGPRLINQSDSESDSYHPATLLKIYLYGYLNRVQSSRRLEREAQRNIELMWLTGRLASDFKTFANFRRSCVGPHPV
jgi:transposase